MDEMKPTQGVMINVGSDVSRFIGKDENPLISLYADEYVGIQHQVEKLARLEELILQQRCMIDDNIKIKLSILRDYVYARCPFYRRDKSTKDIRVIVSRLDLVYGDRIPSIDDMSKDKDFMAKAKAKLLEVMNDEFNTSTKNFFNEYH